MTRFFKKLLAVAIIGAIAFFLCGVYAGNWDFLHWAMPVKGVFIGVVAIVAYFNLMGSD